MKRLDTIDRGDLDGLCGELGDVLFQCVFHAQIAAEAGRFEIADAVAAITGKLIRRHPHVFAPSGRALTAADRRRQSARTASAVLEQWEQIKAREQAEAGRQTRVLAGVPQSMPALLRAHEIGSRVGAVGFDWPDAAGVMAKIEEEVGELREALAQTPARSAEEFGDLLFSLANLGRKLGLDAESALRQANDKFTRRFDALEAGLRCRRAIDPRGVAGRSRSRVGARQVLNRHSPSRHDRPPIVFTSTEAPSVSRITAPSRSVLKSSTRAASRRRTTSGAGWPNTLPRPALMIAICGRNRDSRPAEVEVRLPWWPTFSTRSGADVGLRQRSTLRTPPLHLRSTGNPPRRNEGE